ncbi:MAG: hypothetical protein HY738_05585 [Bacteroidia bacterium]|nr:hypothetical protein [Bacteroidia bacterium]
MYTPDLINETNILVKFLGAGWTSVLMVQSSLVGLTVYLLYFYFFKFKPDRPPENNLTLKQFTSYLFFGDTVSFYKIFYSIPTNKKVLFASLGYIVSLTLIATSFIVGTSTTFLLLSDNYKQLYRQGIPNLLYAIIVGLAIWFTIKYFKTEYKKYKSGL